MTTALHYYGYLDSCSDLTPFIGVSKKSALPNIAGFNTRNLWHNTTPIVGEVSRYSNLNIHFL